MATIAFVHDWIVYPGGAENVFTDLIDTHSTDTDHCTIFTLFSPHPTFHGLTIHTALPQWINTFFHWTQTKKVPILSSLFDYRNLMPFYPFLCWLLQKKIRHFHPDRVIISSFAAAKNIVPPSGRTFHTHLYLHSPMQYIWDNYDEYCTKLTGWKLTLFTACSGYLRRWDKKPRHYDTVETNSQYTKNLALSLYRLDPKTITVTYPELPEEIKNFSPVSNPSNYYLFIGRVVTFVREVDRIIGLANALEFNLLIMGDGPDRGILQHLAGPTVTFLGQRNDPADKYEILRHAKGLINLSKESCGIATMEALALGVPVFGYNAGGTAELVKHGKTGWLVDSKEHEVLVDEFKQFDKEKFERLTTMGL